MDAKIQKMLSGVDYTEEVEAVENTDENIDEAADEN